MSSNYGHAKEKDNRAVILIVDDVEINRMILEEMLYEDYKIEQAANGVEALEKLSDENSLPSLVLLDIMMPEMDGFEVLEKMRAEELTKKIPVIFITSADSTEDEAKGLSVGAIDYITKPFVNNIVKSRVEIRWSWRCTERTSNRW